MLEKAANHIKDWVDKLDIQGLKSEIIHHEGFTSIIFIEVEGQIKDRTIFFYGHYDKQPPMFGWDENMGPTKPVI